MNLLFAWFTWFFIDRSGVYFSAYKNFLKFGINVFSTPLLIKSFFSPWRRIGIESSKTSNIAKMLENIFFNLFSRLFGAFFRAFFILIGLIFAALILIIGLAFYFFWLFLPVLLLMGFFYGLRLLIL